MAGTMKRPAIGGRGLVGGRVVIQDGSPEASAGGRLFPHWRPRQTSRLVPDGGQLSTRRGGGRGCDPSPEPPLVLLGQDLCFEVLAPQARQNQMSHNSIAPVRGLAYNEVRKVDAV